MGEWQGSRRAGGAGDGVAGHLWKTHLSHAAQAWFLSVTIDPVNYPKAF